MAFDPTRLVFRFHRTFIEPWQIRRRRSGRMALLGLTEPPPVASIDVRPTSSCPPECPVRAGNARRYLDRMRTLPERRGDDRRGTLMLWKRDTFPYFLAYADDMKRRTRDGVGRRARVARREGYTTEFVDPRAWGRDIAAVRRSRWFRSGGFVVWRLFPERFARPQGAPAAVGPLPRPLCGYHWLRHLAVLAPPGADGHRHLVAIVTVARAGNFMRVVDVMGHADHFQAGIMDALFYDLIRWTYAERFGGLTSGVEYLSYGVLEHGRPGLTEWKRKYGFAPYVASVVPDSE